MILRVLSQIPKSVLRLSASYTYSIGKTDQFTYEKDNYLLIDADRCAVLRQYLDTLEEDGGNGDGLRGVVVMGF